MTDLEKWAIFFRYANVPECRNIVNDVIDSKEALKVAGERLMSISQDERERAIFRSRRMFQSDYESNLATVEENGVKKGIAISTESTLLSSVQNLMNNMHLMAEQAMAALAIPPEKYADYQNRLTKQQVFELE